MSNIPKNYFKLKGLHTLKGNSVPILQFEVLSKTNYKEQISNFCKKLDLKYFMIRTDSSLYYSPSLLQQNINNYNKKDILKLFNQNYKVFIQESGNIFRNLYSFNLMSENKYYTLEIVGHGFIATHLNRKGLLHEQVILNSNFDIVTRTTYKQRYKIDVKNELKKFDRTKLKNNNSLLLSTKTYKPFGNSYINNIKQHLPNINKSAKQLNYNNYVISGSFVDIYNKNKYELAIWDIYKV